MKILLAGGSGLIGQALRSHFSDQGHEVRILSRSDKKRTDFFHWNPTKGIIDPKAFHQIDVLINLAGSTISEGRWTTKNKELLKKSRVESTSFLIEQARINCPDLKVYIGSSAVGIYKDGGESILTESAEQGDDFLADLAKEWEAAHMLIEKMPNVRSSIVRIGIVLSKKGGAYPVFKKNMILGISPNFGSKLYYPLVHIKDVNRVFQWIIENSKASGIYNLCCPTPSHHLEVFKWAGKYGKKGYLPIPAPKILLRIAMGEQSEIVLRSSRAVPERLLKDGFNFDYGKAEVIIKDLEKT